MELLHKQSRSVAVMCFSFLSGDVNNFVVGTEETAVYTACRHGRYVVVVVCVCLRICRHSYKNLVVFIQ